MMMVVVVVGMKVLTVPPGGDVVRECLVASVLAVRLGAFGARDDCQWVLI